MEHERTSIVRTRGPTPRKNRAPTSPTGTRPITPETTPRTPSPGPAGRCCDATPGTMPVPGRHPPLTTPNRHAHRAGRQPWPACRWAGSARAEPTRRPRPTGRCLAGRRRETRVERVGPTRIGDAPPDGAVGYRLAQQVQGQACARSNRNMSRQTASTARVSPRPHSATRDSPSRAGIGRRTTAGMRSRLR